MELKLATIGFTIFIAVVSSELIRLGVRYFFGQLTRRDYVTKLECEKCPAKDWNVDLNELKVEFAEIKGILLILAVKVGIPAEQLKDLTK